MEYEWDTAKSNANLARHGVKFTDAINFDWSSAIETIDTRFDYGETRWIALGKIYNRVHVLVYTTREDKIRVISLRKANKRESDYYENKKTK